MVKQKEQAQSMSPQLCQGSKIGSHHARDGLMLTSGNPMGCVSGHNPRSQLNGRWESRTLGTAFCRGKLGQVGCFTFGGGQRRLRKGKITRICDGTQERQEYIKKCMWRVTAQSCSAFGHDCMHSTKCLPCNTCRISVISLLFQIAVAISKLSYK